MDAIRLLSGEGSAFEQELLRHGRDEAPSADLEALMMSSVSLANASSLGTAPTPSASLPPPPAAFPWKAVVASGGLGLSLLVGVGLLSSQSEGSPQSTEARTEVSRATPSASHLSAADQKTDRAPSAAALPLPENEGKAESEPTSGKPVASAQSSSSQGLRPASSNQLAEELRQLEQVRAALVAHKPAQAVSLLDRYDARFPSSTLRQEATVLRAKALAAQGQLTQAERVKEDFRKEHPESAHSRQMQGSSGQ